MNAVLKKIGYVIFGLVVIIVVVLVQDIIKIQIHNYNHDNKIKTVMKEVSSSMNENLPKKIDRNTELFTTYYENEKFVYKYRLIGVEKLNIDIQAFEKAASQLLINQNCSKPYKEKVFYQYDIKSYHNFYDDTMNFITSIPFSYKDCLTK